MSCRTDGRQESSVATAPGTAGKRGRPRKERPEGEEPKIPKKRGRPRKNSL